MCVRRPPRTLSKQPAIFMLLLLFWSGCEMMHVAPQGVPLEWA